MDAHRRQLHTKDYLRRLGAPEPEPATTPFDPGYDPRHARVPSRAERAPHGRAQDLDGVLADRRRGGDAPEGGGGPAARRRDRDRRRPVRDRGRRRASCPAYLDLCADIGFDRVECGEGFTDLVARARGGRAHGGRSAASAWSSSSARSTTAPSTTRWVDELVEQGRRWLGLGARALIVEGRESAQEVGLFDERGAAPGGLRGALRRRVRVPPRRLRGADQGEPVRAARALRAGGPARQRAPRGAAAGRDLPPRAALGRLRDRAVASRRGRAPDVSETVAIDFSPGAGDDPRGGRRDHRGRRDPRDDHGGDRRGARARVLPGALARGRRPARRPPAPPAARRRAGRQPPVRLRPDQQPVRAGAPDGRRAPDDPPLDLRDAPHQRAAARRARVRRLPAQLARPGARGWSAGTSASWSSARARAASSARRTSSAARGSRASSSPPGYAPHDERTRKLIRRWSDEPVEGLLVSHSVTYLRETGQEDDLEFIMTPRRRRRPVPSRCAGTGWCGRGRGEPERRLVRAPARCCTPRDESPASSRTPSLPVLILQRAGGDFQHGVLGIVRSLGRPRRPRVPRPPGPSHARRRRRATAEASCTARPARRTTS